MMNVQQFADWLAHLGASEFAKASIPVPDRAVTRSATIELAGVKVVVTVVSAEPMRLQLTPDGQARLGAIAAPVLVLKEIERCIMEAAPRADAEPFTMTKLARIAGYSPNGYFRGHVASLVDRGLLIRITGGVRKAK